MTYNDKDSNLPNGADKNENLQDEPLDENTLLPEEPVEGGVPDLDGDGLVGNTGGFYGGTSYLGSSNYGPEWNKPVHEHENEEDEKAYEAEGQEDVEAIDENETNVETEDDDPILNTNPPA